MLSIINRTRARDDQVHDAFCICTGRDLSLVDKRSHGKCVISWGDGHVQNRGVSDDSLRSCCEGERHVTQGNGDNTRIGIYAKPRRFGSPTAAVRLTRAPVTLNPAKPLSPDMISKCVFGIKQEKQTSVGCGRVVIDIQCGQMTLM